MIISKFVSSTILKKKKKILKKGTRKRDGPYGSRISISHGNVMKIFAAASIIIYDLQRRRKKKSRDFENIRTLDYWKMMGDLL